MSSEDQIAYMDEVIAALDKEIAALQSQNERLVRALEKVDASWQRHGPRIIESRGGLEDNRVCEVNDAIEEAQSILTEIQKAKARE